MEETRQERRILIHRIERSQTEADSNRYAMVRSIDRLYRVFSELREETGDNEAAILHRLQEAVDLEVDKFNRDIEYECKTKTLPWWREKRPSRKKSYGLA